jgi:SAM-dependent methyltransferase
VSPDKTPYDLDPHVAEIYDQVETQTDDVELVRKLIAGKGPRRILEPFCGTGRVFIPLAIDGHEIVALDGAKTMLDRARAKVAGLPENVRRRITLAECDVLSSPWPAGFNLVLLAGNCFYELSSSEEQERCIASAAGALKTGGCVYVDNNHMEGELEASWRVTGVKKTPFPAGICSDGARVEGTSETLSFDALTRLWRARRTILITFPDGRVARHEYVHQKHPVSFVEVRSWLEAHSFLIERTFGDRAGNPYSDASPRAIFWARRQ